MQAVTAQAPGKLMLLGEWAVVYGRKCIVTAVDAPVQATVSPSGRFFFEAPDMKFSGEVALDGNYPREIAFAAKAVEIFCHVFKKSKPVHVTTRSLRPAESKLGLGSSASVTVATLKALGELFNVSIGNRELFKLAYKTVLDVQKVGSGFDVAAAAYGGTLLYRINEPQPISCAGLPLTICYSGTSANTAELVKTAGERIKADAAYYGTLFDEIDQLALMGTKAIEESDWSKLGKLMNRNQQLLREMKFPSQKLGISSEKLEKLIGAALDAGAYGAKLSGAGVGDCMIAVAPESKRQDVKQELEGAGGTIVHAAANIGGVRILEEQ